MARSAQSLLVAIVATTTVVSAALGWAGWRLVLQQRAIDEQRMREQLVSVADAAASRITGRLAEAGEWLNGWLADPAASPAPPPGVVAVTVTAEGTRVLPAGGIPFVPVAPSLPSPAGVFADAERLEFAEGRLQAAAARYRGLSRSPDPAVRAGAWLRLGRVLRRSGDLTGAAHAYRALGAMDDAFAGDLPAGLAGLVGERAVYVAAGEEARLPRIDAAVRRGIDEGRWPLTRGAAELYRLPAADEAKPASWRLAAALNDVWSGMNGRPAARGHRIVGDGQQPVLVVWRSTGPQAALLAAFAETFLNPGSPGSARWRLVDANGATILGDAAASPRAEARVTGPAEQPWTLHVWPGAPPDGSGNGGWLLGTSIAAMMVFVWAATYVIARAVRREAEVARLQSNFVAAVSHEFRSPLTAVRQMAEMLATDRVPTPDRRRTYYGAIAGEAARLQRLVETLLNFGRLESGEARYQLAETDVAAVTHAAARALEPEARAAGMRIALHGPEPGPLVEADESALGVAVRNLIDNAIKYSPGASEVAVGWDETDGRVAVRVRDSGVGIPPQEQRAIFRKFVRGRRSVEANIAGTGVGLSMVDEIVRAHRGQVLVESVPERGSTFTIVLPRAGARKE